MVNKLFIFLVFLVHTDQLLAQVKLRPNQYEGYIILNDLTKKEVIIEVEDANLPWTFQEKVRYFDKSLATGLRVKRENKKDCLPGEIVEYGFGARKFMCVNHYVKDSKDKNIISSTISKVKNDKNTDFFAEVIYDKKITAFVFYVAPEIADEDYDDLATMDKYKQTSESEFDILLSQKNMKPKSVSDINFKNFFIDCPVVLKKFEAGQYEIKPSKGLDVAKVKKGLAGPKLKAAVDVILLDYATMCGNL